ncbi:hypothetical protein ACGFYQ_22825 [Streptomyces sp. NPDC048258]|uniref:hypothetical protein n=1 Tax=Streptomyces sp. NPDC048258 TaxID=3365527 RepID=UPI003718EF52
MRLPRENIDLPEDQGCLRWVLGIPLALVYLPAVHLCFLALIARPAPRDDLAREDIRFMADMSVVLCLLGLLITITPVFRRTMGRWWYALPFLLATVAYARGHMT